MRIADAQWIPSTQHQTWDSLTDPAVLQRCIPGCVNVTQRSPTEYAVTLRANIAGIDTDYEGEILLSDVNAPDSCTLVFEGKGRAACLAIGTAQVNLSTKDQGTRVAYTVAGMARRSSKNSLPPSSTTWRPSRASRRRPLLPSPNPAACPIPDGHGCWSCWLSRFSGAITRFTSENPSGPVIS
jgi:carbon monoxide dehydrogenase subunit G